jgi:protein SCO1/2
MQKKGSQGLAKVLLTASLSLLVFSSAGFILLNLKLKERLSAEGARQSLPVYTRVPPFSLTERSGRPLGLVDLQNKVWIADFIFTTCPGPCPRMSAQMASLQRALEGKEEVRLVSITVDPETDTPEVLTQYADRYQAKNDYWYFLTGDTATIHRLARDGFRVGGVEDLMTHSTRFILVDRGAQVRGYYDSDEEESLNKLLLDVQKLLQEKGA